MSVRVRYAPSPTGHPHLGNIRTALFNFLFARHAGGEFVVRIEDTDRARLVEKSEDAILESLRWLGLTWDEGPDKGGPFAPYVQSERLESYQKAAQELVKKGFAYLCFCTQDRLAEMRKVQEAKHEPPRYDRQCLMLSSDDIRNSMDTNEPHVIRLKVPQEGKTVFEDAVRGHVEFENALLDDQVLLKSDGFPTYHLAVVVDDHAMNITHVIRAEEWISSTPKHLLLYQFFGWTPPTYAHVPMIMDAHKAKLSKRRGAKAMLEYRDAGYLPEVVVNYLSTLGWMHPNEEKLLTLDELAAAFTLEGIKKSPAVFDQRKMDWMNGLAIRQLTDEKLLIALDPFLDSGWDRHVVKKLIPLAKERMTTLKDFSVLCDFFFTNNIQKNESIMNQKIAVDKAQTFIRRYTSILASLTQWTHEELEQTTRKFAADHQLKPADFFMLLRIAFSGKTITPPLFESMVILGKDIVIQRLSEANFRC
ncbi:MAG: glutamate--tRNA ligase [bacterium]|nr:glutamate--tRNA ligase [bacterium]